MPAKVKPPWHRGRYHQQAAAVRRAANANPSTRCWRCGRTLAEIRKAKPHARWQAGHLVDGQVGGPLAPECSPCNTGAGAAMGNRKRRPKPWTSKPW